MTTLIKQRDPNDCGIACIAMALGKAYEEVDAKLLAELPLAHEEVHTKGMQDGVFEAIMLMFNLVKTEDYDKRYFAHHWANLRFAKNMMWGRRSIMTVRSKNIPEGQHYIYWDGHNVFDPSTKLTYDDFHVDCEPFSFWIFNEVGHA